MDLHSSAKADNLLYVRELIASGANVNLRDKSGKSPIYYAIENKNLKIIRLLLMFGSNVNISDNEMKTPLHYVEDVAVAKVLVDKGANVNATDENGRTPLHYADDIELVRFLLDKGAIGDAVDSKGMTPLHYAELHRAEIAEILLENGVNVNAADKKGRTPIHYENRIEIVNILLNHGANLNAKDHEGKTPLFKFERVRLKFVSDVDKDVDSYNNYDDSDLDSDDFFNDKFVSYNDDYIEIIRLLIENGANIHCKDNSGSTVLHYAAQSNNYNVILCLLDLNAEVYCRNKNGKTPLQLIFSNDRIKYSFLNALISRGLCDVNLFQTYNLDIIYNDVYPEYHTYTDRLIRWLNFHDYIVSIKFAKIHLEKRVFKFVRCFPSQYNRKFTNNCKMEIEKLKCTKIDKINSYYDFIKMEDLQLEKYIRNKPLHEILNSDNLKESFPIYSRLITVQYKKLCRRLKLLDLTIPVLSVVGSFSKLPDYCLENIMKYLDNDDLVNILQ